MFPIYNLLTRVKEPIRQGFLRRTLFNRNSVFRKNNLY
ncbi:hypothetical protein LEP1GSC198_1009 [Leptospira kirschneri str. JB]|nr:hypothetical protein LEP1GSC198_1009 [Leptospira kirschneri str. JB]